MPAQDFSTTDKILLLFFLGLNVYNTPVPSFILKLLAQGGNHIN
jgi:hypothetical protein